KHLLSFPDVEHVTLLYLPILIVRLPDLPVRAARTPVGIKLHQSILGSNYLMKVSHEVKITVNSLKKSRKPIFLMVLMQGLGSKI
ncbi:hypothetical protein AKJ66_01900, partial [candidate division MSBL1 archaeon SCGC-AAA259E22]